MTESLKILFSAVVLAAYLGTGKSAFAADPIVGRWLVPSGSIASIRPCGGSFCITLKTGKFAGKRIGKMTGANGKYKGTITDPQDDRTYSGSGKVSGSTLSMKGCVLAILCKTQKWKRR